MILKYKKNKKTENYINTSKSSLDTKYFYIKTQEKLFKKINKNSYKNS